MRNRFKLNESEKKQIRGLHGISEQGLMGNIFNTRDGGHTISKNSIIRILKEIKQLQEEDAPAIAQRRLEELFEKVGLASGETVVEPVVDVEVEDEDDTDEEEPINEQNTDDEYHISEPEFLNSVKEWCGEGIIDELPESIPTATAKLIYKAKGYCQGIDTP